MFERIKMKNNEIIKSQSKTKSWIQEWIANALKVQK